jgi:hypothetical protein
MPRPKPDQIIRHQIVFGEADRKILEGFKDSYLLSNMSGNFVKLINDVTGTATLLALIGISGVLGVTFVFSASTVAIAAGGSSVFDEFYEAFKFAKGEQANDANARNAARANAKTAAKITGSLLDPLPGDPIARIIDMLVPDQALYGRPE